MTMMIIIMIGHLFMWNSPGKKVYVKTMFRYDLLFLRYPEQDYNSYSIIVILIIKKTVRIIDGSLRRVAVVVVVVM